MGRGMRFISPLRFAGTGWVRQGLGSVSRYRTYRGVAGARRRWSTSGIGDIVSGHG